MIPEQDPLPSLGSGSRNRRKAQAIALPDEKRRIGVSRRNGCPESLRFGPSEAVVCWNLADPNTRDSGLVVATESVSPQKTSGTGGPSRLDHISPTTSVSAVALGRDRAGGQGSLGIAVPVIWVGLLSWRRFTRRSGYAGMVALERSTGHWDTLSKCTAR